MKMFKWVAAALVLLAIPAASQSPAQLQPVTTHKVDRPTSQVAAKPASGANAHELTKTDVDAWLDGFVPYALKAGGIPGAVIVVVKDGQTLTMRGFGYADVKARKPVDPERTLFRPGSVSKLLTWTAVMQQVQAGKLNLDEDVNVYLDFKIPPRDGKPITLRHLMTHTAGFAETAKYLINYDTAPPALGKVLSRAVPERIYAPGTMPSYSNYGASLAGYLVERVSGKPFNKYVQDHILTPLQMTRSTFDQPLPANLSPLMSKGYMFGSDDPKPYEVIGMAPAGAMAATGADMGKFMIAHLGNGGPLLNPATTRLMHAPANRFYSALPSMALGFYHEDRNGLNIVGHGGDTVFFHSDMHLFLDKNVGLYLSMNSPGKETAVHPLREQLFTQFTDRYFPAANAQLPTPATAKAHGEAISGNYVSSRAGGFNWLRLTSLLGQTSVAMDKDGMLVVSTVTDPSSAPRRWRAIGPWTWQDVDGTDKLQAVVDGNGKVKMFSITPYAAIIEFLPAPVTLNAAWMLPVAGVAMLVMLIAAIGWPVVALVRRRYKYVDGLSGRALMLHRATRVTGWLFIALIVGWLFIFMLINEDLTALDDRLDLPMRLLQLVLLAAIAGTIAAIWNAWTVLRSPGRQRLRKIWAILIASSAAFLVWFCLDIALLTTSLSY